MHQTILLVGAAGTLAQGAILYASSYAGTVSTLELQGSELSVLSTTSDCAPTPSWLMLDRPNGLLYCIDENVNTGGNGSVNSFAIDSSYALTRTGRQSTSPGPVSCTLYGENDTALAVAHYGTPGAVSAFDALSSGVGSLITQINLGNASNDHEVVLDPSGKYIVTPDLGGDRVRIFAIGSDNTLDEEPDLEIEFPSGTGPRHVAFTSEGNATYMYLVCELSNKLFGFLVTYDEEGAIAFDQIEATNTFGGGAIPQGAAAGEVAVSPDGAFVLVSNRGDASIQGNDTIASYKIASNGTLAFIGLASTGGSYPRQFSLNHDGSQVAVGLQHSAKVNILARNVTTGDVGPLQASVDIPGQITCVVWDE